MIDQEKLDWKEPHLARLKNYAIGGGYALLFVAVVLAVLYFTLKPEDALEKPAIVVQETPVATVAKPAIKKAAAKSINTPPLPVVNKPLTTEKIVEPLTQFDRDLANFESKIP